MSVCNKSIEEIVASYGSVTRKNMKKGELRTFQVMLLTNYTNKYLIFK